MDQGSGPGENLDTQDLPSSTPDDGLQERLARFADEWLKEGEDLTDGLEVFLELLNEEAEGYEGYEGIKLAKDSSTEPANETAAASVSRNDGPEASDPATTVVDQPAEKLAPEWFVEIDKILNGDYSDIPAEHAYEQVRQVAENTASEDVKQELRQRYPEAFAADTDADKAAADKAAADKAVADKAAADKAAAEDPAVSPEDAAENPDFDWERATRDTKNQYYEDMLAAEDIDITPSNAKAIFEILMRNPNITTREQLEETFGLLVRGDSRVGDQAYDSILSALRKEWDDRQQGGGGQQQGGGGQQQGGGSQQQGGGSQQQGGGSQQQGGGGQQQGGGSQQQSGGEMGEVIGNTPSARADNLIQRFMASDMDMLRFLRSIDQGVSRRELTPEVALLVKQEINGRIGDLVSKLSEQITNGSLTVEQARQYAQSLNNPILKDRVNELLERMDRRNIRIDGANINAMLQSFMNTPDFQNAPPAVQQLLRSQAESMAAENATSRRHSRELGDIATAMRTLEGPTGTLRERVANHFYFGQRLALPGIIFLLVTVGAIMIPGLNAVMGPIMLANLAGTGGLYLRNIFRNGGFDEYLRQRLDQALARQRTIQEIERDADSQHTTAAARDRDILNQLIRQTAGLLASGTPGGPQQREEVTNFLANSLGANVNLST